MKHCANCRRRRRRRLYRVGQFWEAISVADKFTVLHISAVRRKAARETNNSMEAVTISVFRLF